jgi:hypothetical protein
MRDALHAAAAMVHLIRQHSQRLPTRGAGRHPYSMSSPWPSL